MASTQRERLERVFAGERPPSVAKRLQRAGFDITYQAIYKWLSGSSIGDENLSALQAVYGVEPAWIKYGTGDSGLAAAKYSPTTPATPLRANEPEGPWGKPLSDEAIRIAHEFDALPENKKQAYRMMLFGFSASYLRLTESKDDQSEAAAEAIAKPKPGTETFPGASRIFDGSIAPSVRPQKKIADK